MEAALGASPPAPTPINHFCLHTQHPLSTFSPRQAPFDPQLALAATTIEEFDRAITIHSFGWKSVQEYYAGSSSSLSVPHIAVPVLCMQVRGMRALRACEGDACMHVYVCVHVCVLRIPECGI